jgi:four helix bundle protein
MFLRLNHQKLVVFAAAQEFSVECYKIIKFFPHEERFNMVQQIRRAALSVVLNIAEGASRRSLAERKRFFEIARSSVVEVDAALDIAFRLGYFKNIDTEALDEQMNKTFSMLTKLLNCK